MKNQIILLLSLGLIVIISGCIDSPVGKAIGLGPSCPDSCDDGKLCTKDFCSEATNFVCTNEPIIPCNGNGFCEAGEFLKSTDCPTCDDGNFCTKDSYNFNTSSCSHTKIIPCCGNAICERGAGESYGSCSSDCEMTKEEAIQSCKEDDFEPYVERCLRTAAVQYKDVSICNEMINGVRNYECVAQVAISLDDISLCKNVSDGKWLSWCVRDYAKEKGDYYACLRSGSSYNQIECFESVYEASNKYKIPPCNDLEGDTKYICLAAVNNDEEYCNKLVDETESFQCIQSTKIYISDDVQDVYVVN